MTSTSVTMYETYGAGFWRVHFPGTEMLTSEQYSAQAAPSREMAWRDLVTARLAELERLAPDWDSDGAFPVGRRHADRAIRFIDRLMSHGAVPVPEIVPLADGGVQLEWRTPHGRRVDYISDEESEPIVLIQDAEELHEFPARSIELAQLLDALLEAQAPTS